MEQFILIPTFSLHLQTQQIIPPDYAEVIEFIANSCFHYSNKVKIEISSVFIPLFFINRSMHLVFQMRWYRDRILRTGERKDWYMSVL